MCIKPELRDIIVGDKSFKDCESKRVVMCLPLTHITKVNNNGVCSTCKCSDVKNSVNDLRKYIMSSENKEVVKSGVIRGYIDSELYVVDAPQTKWIQYSFIIKGVSFREDGSIGFIIETADTIAGRELADRLVCESTDNLHLAISIKTTEYEEVEDLLNFRII